MLLLDDKLKRERMIGAVARYKLDLLLALSLHPLPECVYRKDLIMTIDRTTGEGCCNEHIICDVFHAYGSGTTVDPCQLIYRMLTTKVKIDGKWAEGEPCPEHLAIDIRFPDETFVNRIAEVWFSGSSKRYNEPVVISTKHHIGEELMKQILQDVRGKVSELAGRCSSPSPAGDAAEELYDNEEAEKDE